MLIHSHIRALIGNTPLLQLADSPCRVYAKLEMQNPSGSVKDRVALAMIADAAASGVLPLGGAIIEATSGNTGIGLCAVAAAMGYKITIVMPENMSEERRRQMKAYGANLVLTPASGGMAAAVETAKTIAQKQNIFLPDQFSNLSNPDIHYRTTGPEIFHTLHKNVDIFVCGIGTGGTVTGVGRYLKEQDPSIRIYGLEPAASPFLTCGIRGGHRIQGIGAGFVPAVLDLHILEDILTVTDENAIEAAVRFSQSTGILVGISSGANLWAAKLLAERPENCGKCIVTLLPDTGQRYLSTGIWG